MSKLNTNAIVITDETLVNKIYEFRGQKVMLDSDLAELYGVETKRLNEQVRRNSTRFPEDFMFTLNKDEVEILKSHIATSSWGGRRNAPNMYTEYGVPSASATMLVVSRKSRSKIIESILNLLH
ncbi:ORF6N domain-containing protein [Sphingobacterium nematocida]|uniref:ORF6N domain-containing protein n=1 Tax=Sphingobacterium nematocida TaxID=1513896 RepID=A0A1T5AT30_9SPHI|nr:ORF6N domain-containing protein [Sphingobacterium nematocida]SKB38148.1 ORF6N domain-containing protein [Sphingobacterium nematocida]